MSKTVIKIIVIVVIILGIGVGAYFLFNKKTETASGETNTTVTKEIKNMTAEEITNEMKNQISTMGRIVVYDETTDLNNLLGRPNQYTSKVTFEDTRLEQKNTDNEFLSEGERNEPIGRDNRSI